MPFCLVHGRVHDATLNEFLNLSLDASKRLLIDVAGFELVGVVAAVFINRDDVLALFHRAVRRHVQNSVSLS